MNLAALRASHSGPWPDYSAQGTPGLTIRATCGGWTISDPAGRLCWTENADTVLRLIGMEAKDGAGTCRQVITDKPLYSVRPPPAEPSPASLSSLSDLDLEL